MPAQNYIRFVTPRIHEESRCEKGLFCIAYRVRNSGKLPRTDEMALARFLEWFDENLPVPKRFRHISYNRGRYRAICWFKPQAENTIALMAAMANLISLYGVRIKTIETRQPGSITYEDDQQIAAVAHPETNLRSKPFNFYRYDMRRGQALLRA
jgi:hypothetical protein